MVSNNVIVALIINLIFCILFPIVLLIVFKIKYKFSIKTTLIGAVVFILFSQVLEHYMHLAVISNKLIPMNTVAFAIYGALAAGVFEEVGRFVAFKTLLKKDTEWKDGLGYGVGHGGIEALYLGGLSMLNTVIIAFAIKSNTLGVIAQGQGKAAIEAIKDSIIKLTVPEIAFSGFERLLAFTIQLALSFVVLYGIRKRRTIYLLIAILMHAIVDFPAALYQMKIITSLPLVEVITCAFAVAALILAVKSKKIFSELKE
ncbi:YhfC family glutamic-type intramembrane protease [Clostridium sp. C8-1-8]|uniref:YhfC family intramembrane metalloprotease n=1 Tax=Clostridium sp. C8-1-8 TaxID=2698831 RepID=UPI0013691AE8|nr:YhfC family glutamic-type intramembrane protease [Clostridium sp. C8-1-8]